MAEARGRRGPARPERVEIAPGSELIIVVRPGTAASRIKQMAGVVNAEVRPLFGDLPMRRTRRGTATGKSANLALFYTVNAPLERFDDIASRLRRLRMVESVYVKPPADLPLPPSTAPVPPVTPDFSIKQGYLKSATAGIDARWAWSVQGGDGAGTWVIDVERAWRFSHEDLLQNQGGLIGGFPPNNVDYRDHGTAVVGILGGDANGHGIRGICPAANIRAVSTFNQYGQEHTAPAIMAGAQALRAGDVLVLEMHRPGPRFGFAIRPDRRGYIPVEWFPDDFAAIRQAFSLGVIVVEAAGNGAENLDDGLYDSPGPGFPASWQNPFRRGPADSKAILVGAGAPPGGPLVDRSRLSFSNYGQAVDAQGWGDAVVTTGRGELQGGWNEDRWYTDIFGGTSAATPMVAGAILCVQGMLRAARRPPCTPSQARTLVRTLGSPQQAAVGAPVSQRIGPRPSIRKMAAKLKLPGRRRPL
jgi:hypothetical protein